METTTTPHSSRASSRPRTTAATKQRRRDETHIYINMYSAPPAILGSSLPVTRSLMSSQCCWRGVGRQRARVRTGVRRGPNAPPLRCRGHERSASACGQGAIKGGCFGPYFSTSRNHDYIKPHRTRAGVHQARPVPGGLPLGFSAHCEKAGISSLAKKVPSAGGRVAGRRRQGRTKRHYVSPAPLSSHHLPSPGQQLMTCLAARRQISTEIEAVRWWSTSAEHAVPRLLAIR